MNKTLMFVHEPGRQSTMNLRDGRKLGWYEWGTPNGRPVLFCTGAAMSGSLAFGIEYLADLELRLLAFDRPGLGAPDPDPDKTLSSWTDDIAQVIDANKLVGATAVGFSQGAAFALALAAHSLVKAAAIVSGQDELSHPSFSSLLHPEVARMIAALHKDPDGFEHSFSQMATADELCELIIGMSSEHDRTLYTQETFRTAYLRCLQEGFSQGAEG